MSIADITEDRLGGPREPERTPPHDLLAEQSALGGMLLSKDAVADVIETLRGDDFYIPATQITVVAVAIGYFRLCGTRTIVCKDCGSVGIGTRIRTAITDAAVRARIRVLLGTGGSGGRCDGTLVVTLDLTLDKCCHFSMEGGDCGGNGSGVDRARISRRRVG